MISVMMLAALCASSCSSSENISKTRTESDIAIGAFDKVEVSDGIALNIAIAPADGNAHISCPDNLLDYVSIDVRNNTLRIKYEGEDKNNGNARNRNISVSVKAPSIRKAHATTAATVTVDGNIDAGQENASFSATTAACINLANVTTSGKCAFSSTTAAVITSDSITAASVDCNATTAAKITLAYAECASAEAATTTAARVSIDGGNAAKVKFSATTGSTIAAAMLKATEGSASATTGGDIECDIAQNAKAKKTTGGSVSNRNK